MPVRVASLLADPSHLFLFGFTLCVSWRTAITLPAYFYVYVRWSAAAEFWMGIFSSKQGAAEDRLHMCNSARLTWQQDSKRLLQMLPCALISLLFPLCSELDLELCLFARHVKKWFLPVYAGCNYHINYYPHCLCGPYVLQWVCGSTLCIGIAQVTRHQPCTL